MTATVPPAASPAEASRSPRPKPDATRLADADSPDRLGEAVRVFLRQSSPRVLALLLVVTLGVRLALGGFAWADLAVLLAVALYWPLQEWALHRVLLHLRPRRVLGRRLDPAFARRHRAHHREPWRIDLIFLPLWVHVTSGPLLAALLLIILPATLACTAMVGLVAMALQYEWVHFLVHTRVNPRSAFARRLWRNHRLHHFKSEKHWFGFTLDAVDRLFGTAPDPRSLPTSPTCRTLGVAEEDPAAGLR